MFKIVKERNEITPIDILEKCNKELCLICDETTEELVTDCNHSFCKMCIENWYVNYSNKTCPYCRQDIQHFIKIV